MMKFLIINFYTKGPSKKEAVKRSAKEKRSRKERNVIKKILFLGGVLSLICAGVIWLEMGRNVTSATRPLPLIFAAKAAAKAAETAPIIDAQNPATDEDILKQKFRAVKKYDGTQKSGEYLKEVEVETITREKSTLPLAPDKLTMINFWGAWCAACIAEMPSLNAFEQAHTEISVINIAENRDGYLPVRSAADRLGLQHKNNYYDQRGFVKRWLNVRVFPTKILISPTGDVLYRLEGNIDWNDTAIQNVFDKLAQSYMISPLKTH